MTAFHYACNMSNSDIPRYILDSVFDSESDSMSCFAIAALLTAVDDDEWNCLHFAVHGGKIQVLKYLFDVAERLFSNTNINSYTYSNYTDSICESNDTDAFMSSSEGSTNASGESAANGDTS